MHSRSGSGRERQEQTGYSALFAPAYRASSFTSVMAVFIGSLDTLIIGSALPTIAQRLHGAELYAAALGAYTIASLVGLPLFGALSDRAGPWRAFLLAAAVFLGGSLLGGLAPSMLIVVLVRAVQGIGAGGLFAVGYAGIGRQLPPALQPYGFGLVSGTWGASALIGPAVGAVVIALVGWRWIFWFNVPLVLIIVPAARSAFAGVRTTPGRPAPANLAGPALLGLAAGAMLAAFSAPARWLLPLAGLVALGAALFVWQERHAARPVLPALRRPRSVGGGAMVTACLTGIGFFVVQAYLPLFVQAGRGAPVLVAGGILTAGSLAWTAGSMVAARLMRRGTRWLLTVGHGLFVAGALLLMFGVQSHLPLPELFAGYILTGLGIGFSTPCLFTMALADAAPGAEGSATSGVQVLRSLGSGLGAGLAGLAFRESVPSELFRLLGNSQPAAAIREAGLAGHLDSAVVRTWIVALGFIVLSALQALRLPTIRPGQSQRSELDQTTAAAIRGQSAAGGG